VKPGCRIDSGNPKCAKLAFALPSVTILILASFNNRLFGDPIYLTSGTVISLGFAEDFFVTCASNDASFNSCHVSISSTVREHAAHALDVAVSNLLGCSQLTLTLRLLLCQDVIEMGLGSLEAALTRPAEALGSAPVGFHFRHCCLRFSSHVMYTNQCATTGGY
jgi:hypothetical protein